jgi:CDP-diglyceride synthetase
MLDTLIDLVKTAAPTVATALTGPAGGAVVSMIAKQFGVEDSVEAVTKHLQANPDAAIKLKELDLKELELQNADRDSARKREMEVVKSDAHFITKNITSLLALGTVAGAMIMTALVFFVDFPESQENIIIFALGFLTSAATQVLSYYFGSSSGSKEKDEKIKGLIK